MDDFIDYLADSVFDGLVKFEAQEKAEQEFADSIYHAIETHTKRTGGNLAKRTQAEYKAVVRKALKAGVDFGDHNSVIQYAQNLSPANRNVFSALVTLLSEHAIDERISTSNIENVQHLLEVQALRGKAEMLKKKVKPAAVKSNKRHTWLTTDQVTAILEAYAADDLKTYSELIVLKVLFQTGLRRKESISLKFSDIKMSGGKWIISLTGKGEKDRDIPVPAGLKLAIDAWQKMIKAPGDSYVLRKISWGKLTSSLPYKEVYRVVKNAGAVIDMNTLSTHDTRRTYAERLKEAKVDLLQIQSILGHADPKTTMKYLDMDKPDLPDTSQIFRI